MCKFKLCDGSGFIVTPISGETKKCFCEKERVAQRFYKQAGAPEKYMKLPISLDVNNFVKPDYTDNFIEVKELYKAFHKNIDHFIQSNKHVILSGNYGRGKTQFACSVLLQSLFKNFELKTMYIDANTVANDIYDNEARSYYLKRSKKAQILIIDDLGKESVKKTNRNSDIVRFWNQMIRNFNGLLFVTTNKKPEKENLIEFYGNESIPMVEALLGGATNFKFVGDNLREKKKLEVDSAFPGFEQ